MMIFFSGWGMDARTLAAAALRAGFKLSSENVILSDYARNLLDSPDEFFRSVSSMIPQGEKAVLAGWSFGCLPAFMALRHEAFASRVDEILLFSGTLKMLDKRLGIPPAAVELTKARLSEANFASFAAKTFADGHSYDFSGLDVEARRNELAAFMQTAERYSIDPADVDFGAARPKVFCGSADLILPAASARRYWGELLTETSGPHGGPVLFKHLS